MANSNQAHTVHDLATCLGIDLSLPSNHDFESRLNALLPSVSKLVELLGYEVTISSSLMGLLNTIPNAPIVFKALMVEAAGYIANKYWIAELKQAHKEMLRGNIA